MICKKCGTEINTRICYNCGFDNYEKPNVDNTPCDTRNIGQQNAVYQPTYSANDGMFGNGTLSNKNGTSATITAGTWFKFFGLSWLISLIPIVGPIGAIIYYIVLLCKDTTAPSIKGHIKFSLIVTIIALVVTVLAVVVLISIMGSLLPKGDVTELFNSSLISEYSFV